MNNLESYDDINQFMDNSVEIDPAEIEANSVEIDPADLFINNSVDIESNYTDSDTDKAWYILPMILDDKKLYNKNNINNIKTIDMTDKFLIEVTYRVYPINFDIEKCFYSAHNSDDGVVVVYEAPKDKEYICRMVAKSGHKVLTKDMLMTYFVK